MKNEKPVLSVKSTPMKVSDEQLKSVSAGDGSYQWGASGGSGRDTKVSVSYVW